MELRQFFNRNKKYRSMAQTVGIFFLIKILHCCFNNWYSLNNEYALCRFFFANKRPRSFARARTLWCYRFSRENQSVFGGSCLRCGRAKMDGSEHYSCDQQKHFSYLLLPNNPNQFSPAVAPVNLINLARGNLVPLNELSRASNHQNVPGVLSSGHQNNTPGVVPPTNLGNVAPGNLVHIYTRFLVHQTEKMFLQCSPTFLVDKKIVRECSSRRNMCQFFRNQ